MDGDMVNDERAGGTATAILIRTFDGRSLGPDRAGAHAQ